MPRDRSLNNPGSPHDRSGPGGRGDKNRPVEPHRPIPGYSRVGGGGKPPKKKGCLASLFKAGIVIAVIAVGLWVIATNTNIL